jgi:hypothetical protein
MPTVGFSFLATCDIIVPDLRHMNKRLAPNSDEKKGKMKNREKKETKAKTPSLLPSVKNHELFDPLIPTMRTPVAKIRMRSLAIPIPKWMTS